MPPAHSSPRGIDGHSHPSSCIVPLVRYPPREAFVANTDWDWFEFLSDHADAKRHVDEVNFWSPRATRPMAKFILGEPVFFRLKKPRYAVAGHGFFAGFHVVDLDTAWDMFTWKNGDPSKDRFLSRIGKYRGVDLRNPRSLREPIGCMVLRDAVFWPQERWLPWGDDAGWSANIVQGRTETTTANVDRLMSALRAEELELPADLADSFIPLDVDERRVAATTSIVREGQGAFRLRLLHAYDGRCAITGEHTEPVLDAAHIQPYVGAKSNHIQNGLLLTKEFHALFDRGYVTVTPDLEVCVSTRLKSEWKNGKRYYPYDGERLVVVPGSKSERPSPEALEWHNHTVFRTG